MDVKLRQTDTMRIYGDYKENNFIDIQSVGYESLAVDLFGSFVYIEVRQKENLIRVFTFPKKSYKKECDFGWWDDAEVVFSLNKRLEKSCKE